MEVKSGNCKLTLEFSAVWVDLLPKILYGLTRIGLLGLQLRWHLFPLVFAAGLLCVVDLADWLGHGNQLSSARLVMWRVRARASSEMVTV